MTYFAEYQPSDRHARGHVMKARLFGWVVVVTTIALMHVQQRAGPGLWAALGMGGGSLLILRGAILLRREQVHKTPLGRHLLNTMDTWFPWLLFGFQSVILLLAATILWLSAVELGVKVYTLTHINFFCLMALIPIRRVVNEHARMKGIEHRQGLIEGVQCLIVIFTTTMVAFGVTQIFIPLGHPITGDNTPPLIVIWVIATLVVLGRLLLYLDHMIRKRHEKR